MQFSFSTQNNVTNFLDCDDLSYCSLMELFEDNYFLLKNILQSDNELFLKDELGTRVHFSLVESQKYTSIYNFTIDNGNNFINDPSLKAKLRMGKFTLRMYHDARVVEADLANKNRSNTDDIKRNWFINSYLNECLKSINQTVVIQRKLKERKEKEHSK
jgi:uncharacterized protein YqiB (DUF1249 family)